MASVASQIVARDFSLATRRALQKRGVSILGPVLIPDANGSYLNPERAWSLDDNGTYRVVGHLALLKMAA